MTSRERRLAGLLTAACALFVWTRFSAPPPPETPPYVAAAPPPAPTQVPIVAEASAAEPPRVVISSSELPSGGIMAVRDGVKLGPFTLEHTEVKAEVSGRFARVEVSQRYVNPHKGRIEAIYAFPLPEKAAVTDMFIRISSRVIASEVQERAKAKETYENAKKSGKVAALLEQERPNIFTQSLANIPPGEPVFVHIKYVHELAYDDGRYRFVFPMTIGPRYIPGEEIEGKKDAGLGWAHDTDAVPDASRITPVPLAPGERSGHDISVSVDLKPGLPIADLKSVSHQLVVSRPAAERAKVSLSPSDNIPNKDFTLEWRLRGAKPEVGALATSDKKGDGYLQLLVQPQAEFKSDEVSPKEMVFVIDTSGSQSGEPLAKEKQLVRKALQNMNPRDTFRVMRFDDRPVLWRDEPLSGTPENIRDALSWVNGLNATSGTNLRPALRLALDAPRDPLRRRMVFFLTDGYIGNEAQVLGDIQERLGDARIFSFGCGSSVNRYLLEKMAELGKGFAQMIRNDESGDKAVELFYRRVRNPLLLDLKLDWGGLPVTSVLPETMPDLYDNQPLSILARFAGPSTGTITLTGSVAGKRYERKLFVKLPKERAENRALAPLWARRRVEVLSDKQFHGEIPAVVEEIKNLGLKYKLVTQYTSFVAVERFVSADANLPLDTVLIPNEMPEGVSFEGVFGRDAAQVSIPRMKPGDPVLSVDAPRGTKAVIAEFPFGPRRLCKFDASRERWACRFLVPRAVPDGVYIIKVTCIGARGERTRMEARYTVDSKAPLFEITALRVGDLVELKAFPKAFVLENGAHDVKSLRARGEDGRTVSFKLEKRPGEFVWSARLKAHGSLMIEAVDFAGNIRLSKVLQ